MIFKLKHEKKYRKMYNMHKGGKITTQQWNRYLLAYLQLLLMNVK